MEVGWGGVGWGGRKGLTDDVQKRAALGRDLDLVHGANLLNLTHLRNWRDISQPRPGIHIPCNWPAVGSVGGLVGRVGRVGRAVASGQFIDAGFSSSVDFVGAIELFIKGQAAGDRCKRGVGFVGDFEVLREGRLGNRVDAPTIR